MKLSIAMISVLITSAIGASVVKRGAPVKRQNDIPSCVKGDTSTIDMPGGGCSEGCYMTEQEGDRVGQICKGKCVGIPIWTGPTRFDCYNN